MENKCAWITNNLGNSGLTFFITIIMESVFMIFFKCIFLWYLNLFLSIKQFSSIIEKWNYLIDNNRYYKVFTRQYIMAIFSKKVIFFLVFLFLISDLEAKAKITRIDDTNFEKFQNDGSYWIIQISNAPCPECQSQ